MNGSTRTKEHDPEKLLELFKKSKATVKKFVDAFQAQNGRQPHGADLASAPEYVRVCIKNCKRIKAHLAKKAVGPDVTAEEKKLEQQTDIKPQAKAAKEKKSSKIWGAHLNRSISDITNSSTDKQKIDLSRTTSYSGTLSALVQEDVSKSTRKSLSKRRKSSRSSFFETLGDESTLLGLIDAAEVTMTNAGPESPPKSEEKVDPLVRFHPELSVDGLSQHGQNQEEVNDEDCEIGFVSGAQSLRLHQQVKSEGKSMSFLTSVTGKDNVQARSRNFELNNEEIPLSFSGLFPKKQSEKRKNEDNVHHDESSNESKKQKLSDCDSDEDMFADDDDDLDNNENVDTNNTADLLPYDPKADYQDESKEKKEDRRKRKNPKKLTNGLVSSNFVKIDLKKKNYVRGSKHLTGAKYKRMEWKRKVQGKFSSKR